MIKTIIGNFLKVAQNSGKFPVDAETLENFQNNTALTAALGAALGKNYVILTGCIKSGNNRSEGYVYVKLSASDPGEVLYFPGGNSNEPNCYVRADDIDVTAKGEPYEKAYTSRILSNGLPSRGEKKLAWNDFVTGSEIFAQKTHSHAISDVTNLQRTLDTFQSNLNTKLPKTTYDTGIANLQNKYDPKIQSLEHAVSAPAVAFVKGMIIMWGGSIANIPQGWHLCDGTGGTVNLKDRFIVGAGGSYAVGATGGSNSVTLTTYQMPSHSHILKSCSTAGKHWHYVYNDSGAHKCDSSNNFWCAGDKTSSINVPPESSSDDTSSKFGHTDWDGAHTHTIELNSTGSDQSHENRPPYYALAYIQYIGV